MVFAYIQCSNFIYFEQLNGFVIDVILSYKFLFSSVVNRENKILRGVAQCEMCYSNFLPKFTYSCKDSWGIEDKFLISRKEDSETLKLNYYNNTNSKSLSFQIKI